MSSSPRWPSSNLIADSGYFARATEEIGDAGDGEHALHRDGLAGYEAEAPVVVLFDRREQEPDAGRVDESQPSQVDDDARGSVAAGFRELFAHHVGGGEVELPGKGERGPVSIPGNTGFEESTSGI